MQLKTLKLELHVTHFSLECFTIFTTEVKQKVQFNILRKRDELILRGFKAPLEKRKF